MNSHQFHLGIGAGLVAAGVAALLTGGGRRRIPIVGVAFAVAAYVALARSGNVAAGHRMPVGVLAGAACSCVLAELAIRVRPKLWVVAAAGVPGALITAGALVGVPTWIRVVVAAFCAVGGACVGEFDARNARSGAAPLLWLLTVGAVYSTVPDTEAARALVGVAIPIACLGWPIFYARIGVGGAAASACVLGWVIGQDGVGRPGSVVGAAGALGIFVLEPVVRRAFAYARNTQSTRAVALLPALALQLGFVLVAARWAGLAHDASTASVRLLIALPVELVLTWWLVGGFATGARPEPTGQRSPTPLR